MKSKSASIFTVVFSFMAITFSMPVLATKDCSVDLPAGNSVYGAEGLTPDTKTTGTLATALYYLAKDNTNHLCSDSITINEDVVEIEETLTIKKVSEKAFALVGGGNSFKSTITDGSPMFLVRAHDVTISDITIISGQSSGQSSPFVQCDKEGSSIELKDVTIANKPDQPLLFDGCDNVTFTNVIFTQGSNTHASSSTNVEPFVKITNSKGVNLGVTFTKGSIDRDGVVIEGGTDVSVTMTVESNDNASATALKIKDVVGLEQLGFTGSSLAGSAVSLENVNNGDGIAPDYSVTATGTYGQLDQNTASGDAVSYVAGLGDGVIVKNSNNFTFNNSSFNNFSRSGLAVVDSKKINVKGSEAGYNGAYGVVFKGGENAINNVITSYNGNCGVALAEAHVVKDVQFLNNGNKCSLGVPASLQVKSGITFMATDATSATLDVVRDSLPDATNNVDLHNFFARSTTITGGSGREAPEAGAERRNKLVTGLKNLVGTGTLKVGAKIKDKYTRFDGEVSQAVANGVEPQSSSTATESMILNNVDEDNLPKDNVSISSVDDSFMIVLKKEDGTVTGVWYGYAKTLASTEDGTCEYYFDEARTDCACFQSDSSSESKSRVDRAGSDIDGDGLKDSEELGGVCPVNSANAQAYQKTDPNNADSDGDGISDGDELQYVDNTVTGFQHMNPTKVDSDGDGLNDNVEDSCPTTGANTGVGYYDQGCETSAVNADTDGDGLNDRDETNGDGVFEPMKGDTNPLSANTDGDSIDDKDDKYPLCNQETTQCTYSDCRDIDAINDATNGSFSISDAEAKQSDDSDDDGLADLVEDSGKVDPSLNYNCIYDAANLETNPMNPDTDGDGCKDGLEDRSLDGKVDDGETDPRKPDTDGDGILDGVEAEGCLFVAGDAEHTDPLKPDTDGDGIDDGVEDRNFDGILDAGETDPFYTDTDQDRLLDSSWYDIHVLATTGGDLETFAKTHDLSPRTYDTTNTIVNYYCGVSSMADVDTDGDMLPDSVEASDCKLDRTKNGSSNPLSPDTDGDGLLDDLEICYHSSPWSTDTEGDGQNDYKEVSAGGRISVDVMRATCSAGPLLSEGATDPTATTSSCSLNSDSLATSTGHYPITVMMLMLLAPLALRRRQSGVRA